MFKISKTHYKHIGYAILCVFLLPILPLIVGVYVAVKVFKNNPDKKRGFGLAVLSLVVSFFLTGLYIDIWPDAQKVTPHPTPSPTVQITPVSSFSPTSLPTNRTKATLVRVIDGDTMDFNINGKTERVRVIGINTPESVDPRKSVECFGREASRQAELYFKDNREVELEADPTQGDRDKYGRLLRYVFTHDGAVDFGQVMISLGYAYEYTYAVPYRYQAIYKQAQQEAETGKSGLWADDACVAAPGPTISSSEVLEKYSCIGPDLDCPDFSTHAEAQAFFDGCGFTATNDPMKLDNTGIGDGIACESLP